MAWNRSILFICVFGLAWTRPLNVGQWLIDNLSASLGEAYIYMDTHAQGHNNFFSKNVGQLHFTILRG